jgi:ribosome biogenesis GTPase
MDAGAWPRRSNPITPAVRRARAAIFVRPHVAGRAFGRTVVYELSTLGFGPFFQEQQQSLKDLLPARVAAEHRGGYQVWAPAFSGLARLSGKLRLRGDLATVGDWVGLRPQRDVSPTAVIEHIFQRRTALTRGGAGREARSQVIAANVDQVFVVCGLDTDFNVRRIERYLARIWSSGATPAVILNKADLCSDVAAAVRETERHAAGVSIFVTCAMLAEGVPAIATTLAAGTTTAFVGSSGAGKSTLVNALSGEQVMSTGKTCDRDGRGRHTTSHRQLVLLPQGGLLLDTPGMRELQLLDEDGLDRAFDEVETLAARCRFRDCSHEHEPGCAVKAALHAGVLDAGRLNHYHQLQREARANERRHDEHLRRQSERVWGQLHAEAARLRKWKEGG